MPGIAPAIRLLIRILPIQRNDMPDGLDQLRTGLLADLSTQFLALFAVSGVDPHFDEFMVIQGKVDFVQNRFGDPGIAGDDDGFQGVGFGAELLLLFGFQTNVLLTNN